MEVQRLSTPGAAIHHTQWSTTATQRDHRAQGGQQSNYSQRADGEAPASATGFGHVVVVIVKSSERRHERFVAFESER